MDIWYKTSPRLLGLHEVQVTRHTENSVWEHVPALFHGEPDLESKQKRHSDHSDYWPTLDQALTVLRRQAVKQRERAQEQLDEAMRVIRAIDSGHVKAFKRVQPPKLQQGETIQT